MISPKSKCNSFDLLRLLLLVSISATLIPTATAARSVKPELQLWAPTVSPLIQGAIGQQLASPLLGAHHAMGDFDGDNKLDLAQSELQILGSDSKLWGSNEHRYQVRITLSSGVTSHFELNLAHAASLNVEARDIDGDQDLDLVITAGLLHEPVGLLINDGTGVFMQGSATLYGKSVWRAPPALEASKTVCSYSDFLVEGRSLGLLDEPTNLPTSLLEPSESLVADSHCPLRETPVKGRSFVRPPPSLFLL